VNCDYMQGNMLDRGLVGDPDNVLSENELSHSTWFLKYFKEKL